MRMKWKRESDEATGLAATEVSEPYSRPSLNREVALNSIQLLLGLPLGGRFEEEDMRA
jgi:hypothetical protein